MYLLLSGCATVPPPQASRPSEPAARPVTVPPAVPSPRPVAAAAEPLPPAAALLGTVSFAVTGDIMAHGEVKKAALAADGGFDALYAPTKAVVEPVDLAFGNLETPIAPDHDHGSRPFVFNAPPVMLDALKRTGFDVVLFANNHVYDQDRDGFIESLARIDASGLKQVGGGSSREKAQAPLRLEVHGVKLAWFGAAQFFNNPQNVDDPSQPYANLVDGKAMADAIRAVRPDVDAVLVSLHWGVEYMEAPRQAEIDLAHQLFEAGADVIIGSHPHVLQPLEVYRAHDGRTCLCLYSLGNFISNQSRQYLPRASADKVGDPRDGAIVRFTLEKRSYGGAGSAVNLASISYVPLWTDNNYFKAKSAPADIHPVVIDVELTKAREALQKLEASAGKRPDREQAAQIIALRQRLDLLTLRRARIVARLGEDFSGDP
jgi:poly-gamma-glutamate capsule biosynthesis protein CapA/YwtB (metallophosphatase superfamily)